MHCSTAGFCKPFNQVTAHVLNRTADKCLSFTSLFSHLLAQCSCWRGQKDGAPCTLFTPMCQLYTVQVSYSGILGKQHLTASKRCTPWRKQQQRVWYRIKCCIFFLFMAAVSRTWDSKKKHSLPVFSWEVRSLFTYESNEREGREGLIVAFFGLPLFPSSLKL